MSISGTSGDLGTKKDSFQNWETVSMAAYWDPSNTGGNPDSGNIVSNQLFTDTEIDLPDQHVMAIHGFRTHISDPVEADNGPNEVDLFIFNDIIDQKPLNGFNNRTTHSEYIYGFSTQFHRNSTNGVGVSQQGGPFFVDFPLPVLNPDGEVTVQQVGTTVDAGMGEATVQMLYDIIPVDSTEKYLELLLKR